MDRNGMCCLNACVCACALLAMGRAAAESLIVPADSTHTVESSATYESIDVNGTLIVPSGKTISADAISLGSAGNATVSISGTLGSSSAVTAIGEAGGNVTVGLNASGATFQTAAFTVNAATAPHASGFVDFLTVSPGSGNEATFTTKVRCNYSAHTNRIRVLSGHLYDGASALGYYDSRYVKAGSNWLYDLADGTYVLLSRDWRAGAFNGSGATVTFRGEGAVHMQTYCNECPWSFNSGVVFANAGGISTCDGSGVIMEDGVVFTDTFGGMTLQYANNMYFGGNFNLGSLTVTSTGRFLAKSGKSPTLTFGTANRDATFTGEVFAQDCGLTLVKTGTGTLTTSATTPFLPALALDGGALVIRGDLTCSGLTMAAGTSVTVDGNTWTIEGAQLTQAAGSTLSVTNGGTIVVKTVDGRSPTFAPGSALDVRQYWIDGTRQPNGTYTVGGATLTVYEFIEPDEIWTNFGKSGTTYEFASRQEYKGFDLVPCDAPLAFTGGPVALGSSGMVVRNPETSETFHFDLSLYAPVDQTWAFGNSSAVFSKPLTKYGSQSGNLTVTSTNDLVFATTNSTHAGGVSVTARHIVISGYHPFGTGREAPTVTADAALGSDRSITLRDVTFAQSVTFSTSAGDTETFSLDGTNELQFTSFDGFNCAGMQFKPNSVTIWRGPVEYGNRQTMRLCSGARVVFKDEARFTGYWGVTGYLAIPDWHAAANPVLRFEAPAQVEDGKAEKRAYGDCFPILLFGQTYDAGLRLELAVDHAFSRGWFKTEAGVEIDLCGHDQGLSRLTGACIVTSAAPAFLELSVPAGTNEEMTCAFAGQAGLKMLGGGSALLTGASTTAGSLVVSNGTVELAAAWPNATAVGVANGGRLTVGVNRAFSRNTALSLEGVGALAVSAPSGTQRVGSLTLVNPSTGEKTTYRAGTFDAANSWGLISSGTVRVVERGAAILIR